MKRNYLIFSLIFIVSTIALTSILASVEIREFSITSDFAEDLRLDLPAYSFKETEPDIQTFYSIDYLYKQVFGNVIFFHQICKRVDMRSCINATNGCLEFFTGHMHISFCFVGRVVSHK